MRDIIKKILRENFDWIDDVPTSIEPIVGDTLMYRQGHPKYDGIQYHVDDIDRKESRIQLSFRTPNNRGQFGWAPLGHITRQIMDGDIIIR